jgi:hypothetical protein
MPEHSRTGLRVIYLLAGAVTSLLAIGALVVGGAALWIDHKKDDHGFVSTKTHAFETRSAALNSKSLDVNLYGAGWLVNSDHYGKVRLKVEPRDGTPLFVGIARTRDVQRYLGGVAHSTVTDVDLDPFEATYSDHGGARRATPPARKHIWAASTTGSGRQTLTWDVADGNWSVVVMNADGSPGVNAGVSAGAKVAWMAAVGWSSLGFGLLLLAGSAGLFVLSARPRRRSPSGPAPEPAVANV